MLFKSKLGRSWEVEDEPTKVTAEMAQGRGVVEAIAFRGVKKVAGAQGEEKFLDTMPGRIAELKADAELAGALKLHFGLVKPPKKAEAPPVVAVPKAIVPPVV